MPVQLPPTRGLPDPERMLREILADNGDTIDTLDTLDTLDERRRRPRGPIIGGILVAAAALAITAVAVPAVLHRGGTIAASPSASPLAPMPTHTSTVHPTPGHVILRLGDTAQFDHVTVTARRIELRLTIGTLVDVRVCARPRPSGAPADAVPISWGQWRIVNGEGEAGASLQEAGPVPKPGHLLPRATSLRAGQCVEGVVPFSVDEHSPVISVRYADAQGDTAVWAAG